MKSTWETRKPYNGAARSLAVALDVGTTFSGVSYAILEPGEVPKIHGVTRFPGQEHVAGNSKIPTIMYYDKNGSMVSAGAEAEGASIEAQAEDDGWTKAELFKLRLRPKSMKLDTNGMRFGHLPRGKTAVDLFGDFLGYLFRCTRIFIIDTHANGPSLWKAVEKEIQFVLSHPNGWEGAQQSKMRRAAIRAGVIPDTDEGKARIRFVTEGEASLHACVLNGLAADVLSNPSGHGFLVADAGGGTLDISSYAMRGVSPLVIEEIAPPDCIFAGSVFVSRRAREFFGEKLKNSRYGTRDSLDHITKRFDETTKRLFRSTKETQFVHFGSPLDKDLAVGIRGGQLKLTGDEVADLFEPSIQAAIRSIQSQIHISKGVVKSVWLVGGFAASPWLFAQLQARLEPLNVTVSRPDSQTSKAVADGAIGFYCDHHVSARMSKCMYGVEFLREYDPHDEDHVLRQHRLFELPSGPRLLPDAFDCILTRGVKVKESTTFSRKYCTELTSLSTLSVFEVEVWCYRGMEETPKWILRNREDFTTLCFVRADLSPLSGSAQPKIGKGGKTYWTIVFSIEIHFGLTEFKARIKWNDNGRVRYGPASIVYNEHGTREEEEEAENLTEDLYSMSAQHTSRPPSRVPSAAATPRTRSPSRGAEASPQLNIPNGVPRSMPTAPPTPPVVPVVEERSRSSTPRTVSFHGSVTVSPRVQTPSQAHASPALSHASPASRTRGISDQITPTPPAPWSSTPVVASVAQTPVKPASSRNTPIHSRSASISRAAAPPSNVVFPSNPTPPGAATPVAESRKSATPIVESRKTSISSKNGYTAGEPTTPKEAGSRAASVLSRQGYVDLAPAATPPVVTPLAATPPFVTLQVATPPVVTPPVVTLQVATPPVATPPAATPPVVTLPVAAPAAATPSVVGTRKSSVSSRNGLGTPTPANNPAQSPSFTPPASAPSPPTINVTKPPKSKSRSATVPVSPSSIPVPSATLPEKGKSRTTTASNSTGLTYATTTPQPRSTKTSFGSRSDGGALADTLNNIWGTSKSTTPSATASPWTGSKPLDPPQAAVAEIRKELSSAASAPPIAGDSQKPLETILEPTITSSDAVRTRTGSSAAAQVPVIPDQVPAAQVEMQQELPPVQVQQQESVAEQPLLALDPVFLPIISENSALGSEQTSKIPGGFDDLTGGDHVTQPEQTAPTTPIIVEKKKSKKKNNSKDISSASTNKNSVSSTPLAPQDNMNPDDQNANFTPRDAPVPPAPVEPQPQIIDQLVDQKLEEKLEEQKEGLVSQVLSFGKKENKPTLIEKPKEVSGGGWGIPSWGKSMLNTATTGILGATLPTSSEPVITELASVQPVVQPKIEEPEKKPAVGAQKPSTTGWGTPGKVGSTWGLDKLGATTATWGAALTRPTSTQPTAVGAEKSTFESGAGDWLGSTNGLTGSQNRKSGSHWGTSELDMHGIDLAPLNVENKGAEPSVETPAEVQPESGVDSTEQVTQPEQPEAAWKTDELANTQGSEAEKIHEKEDTQDQDLDSEWGTWGPAKKKKGSKKQSRVVTPVEPPEDKAAEEVPVIAETDPQDQARVTEQNDTAMVESTQEGAGQFEFAKAADDEEVDEWGSWGTTKKGKKGKSKLQTPQTTTPSKKSPNPEADLWGALDTGGEGDTPLGSNAEASTNNENKTEGTPKGDQEDGKKEGGEEAGEAEKEEEEDLWPKTNKTAKGGDKDKVPVKKKKKGKK